MNFNFDFSKLPASRVRGGSEPELVGVFAALVNAAPRPLGIKEVIAVAEASGIKVPCEATVRGYLNRAVADGRIVKPTRQSYGPAAAAADDEFDLDVEADDEVENEDEEGDEIETAEDLLSDL